MKTDRLLTTLRVGILVVVSFAVLSHGAVETWARTLLALAAAVLFLLWGAWSLARGRLEIRWNSLFLPLLAFGGLVAGQWLGGLSLYPYLTKVALLQLTVYFILVFLGVQSYRTSQDLRVLLWFLLFFGFGVALLGIVQHLTFNGKLYWIRELRFGGSPFGPFVNRNHFAGLMELLVPFGLAAVAFRALKREEYQLVVWFTIVMIGALFLSASRAGILCFLFQLLLLLVYARRRRHRGRNLWAFTMVILLAGFFTVWLGIGPVLDRFSQLLQQDLSYNRRLVLSQDTGRIFTDHPWVGTGWGTFANVFPGYASSYVRAGTLHAHNDYVQLLAETGAVGMALALAFVVLFYRKGLGLLQEIQDPLRAAMVAGGLVACSGILLHSLVDFNLQIPSNALLFFLLVALATSPISVTPSLSPAKNAA